jgi:hypothetical protein
MLAPIGGAIGEGLEFRAVVEDPGATEAAVRFAWGDGDTSEWSSPADAGDTVRSIHSYSSAGYYTVAAQARNRQGLASAWCPPNSVHIGTHHPLPKPLVQSEVVPYGETLRLHWPAVPGASSYRIYLDDSMRTTSATTFDVAWPHKIVEVAARDTFGEGLRWSVNTKVVVTESVTVWGISDPYYTLNAFGFDSMGAVFAIDISNQGSWPLINYVMEDREPEPMSFWSPSQYAPPINDMWCGAARPTTTDFDAKVAANEIVFASAMPISRDSVYSLWIDPTDDGWSLDDHFGKAKVLTIEGTLVTLKLGYQMIGGLLWTISR